MSRSTLYLHKGSQEITRAQLARIVSPPPTATWYPVKHADVLKAVEVTLTASGFRVAKAQLSVSGNHQRFFGTLDLATPVSEGVTLSVGIRNSTDQTLPLGFCAGHRVFVCDNLAFRSELLVHRKHTLNGRDRFREAIAKAIQTLDQFREVEARRIESFKTTEIGDERAESFILRAYERGILSPRTLPSVIQHWREPSHIDFKPRTLWSLLNAATAALAPRARTNPQAFASLTISLQGLLDPLFK